MLRQMEMRAPLSVADATGFAAVDAAAVGPATVSPALGDIVGDAGGASGMRIGPDGGIGTGGAGAGAARLGHVDALRFVAAALVLLQHVAERMAGPVAHALIAPGPGVMGVVLFFLVSGYVIPFSVRRGLDWRAFALRRLLRIYPLFGAALALAALAGGAGLAARWAGLGADLWGAGGVRWLANLLFVDQYLGVRPILGVSWTLSIELAWYALFAAALLALGRRAADVLALAVPAGLVVLALASLLLDSRIPLGRPGLVHAAVLGWQVWRWRDGQLGGGMLGVNVAVFLAVTWFTAGVAFGVFSHGQIALGQVIGPWTAALGVFLAVICPARVRDCALLSRGVLPMLGAASYSIYLLHPIATAVAFEQAPGAFVPVALGLTALLSLAGYRWVERPGMALGRRLVASLPARPIRQSPAVAVAA